MDSNPAQPNDTDKDEEELVDHTDEQEDIGVEINEQLPKTSSGKKLFTLGLITLGVIILLTISFFYFSLKISKQEKVLVLTEPSKKEATFSANLQIATPSAQATPSASLNK